MTVRWSEDAVESLTRAALIRRAWERAYPGIFEPQEMESVFTGRCALEGSWLARRTRSAGTLVAVDGGVIIGLAGLAWMEEGVGEVAALYVEPDLQHRGIGTQLWDASLEFFAEWQCASVEVWTLARSAACRFYAGRGCAAYAQGWARIRSHVEPAVGYRRELERGSGGAP